MKKAALCSRVRECRGRDSQPPRLSLVRGDACKRRNILMIGSVIGGHIRILEALGQGGMGEVYVALDERLGRRVAVKTIRADRHRSDDARARFLFEARALSALDHPDICRIYEYIESPEGDFLVLELIEGTTLGRALAGGLSRSNKLRVAAGILSALIAAHRKGIVHRDLKPDNVMITREGGVKVLDFGIAQLEVRDEGERAAAVGGEWIEETATLIFPIDDARTAALPGRIIAGTPLYMSPEQAAGGDVTPASDMYSFGLLLQTLLTEEPPRDAALSQPELLRQAARGERRPLTGQRRDVTALVTTLVNRAPADRPAAAEALTSVQRILDAPKRRVRLAAAALAIVLVLAGATKYALDVTAARDEARRGRRQAEQLVGFMVGDLREKLEAVGRLDVLDGAASRALAYFTSLRPDELTGEDLDHNARALAQLGQVREREGKLPEAIALFRQSVRFADVAVGRDASRDDWQLTLSNARFRLGDAFRREGNLPETLRNFEAYFRISQQLAQRHPGDTRYQAELSYGHGNLGAAHEAAGNIPRALAEYQIACDLDRVRLRQAPANEQWQGDLANSLNRLGVILKSRGDFSGARRAFDEDLQFRRRLAQASPDDARRQQRLAVSLAYAGGLQQATGDSGQALVSYREEAELTATLARRDPASADAKRNHAVAQLRVASLAAPAEALPLAEAATRELRELARADARAVWRRDLVGALVRLAGIRSRLDDRTAAGNASAEALAASEALVRERPQDAVCIRLLCEALLIAAGLDERDGRLSLANLRRTRVADLASTAAHDPSAAAARVRALFALGRRTEASPIARKLLADGYAESEFVALVAAARPADSPPPRPAP